MAKRIEINAPRSSSEDEAQRILARILPGSWVVTTNIKEHMFPGRRKPEIDCILITPLGLFVLDFKNYRGVITPASNEPWHGSREANSNPFEQMHDNLYPVKDLLSSHDDKLKDIWIEPLIVLVNEDAQLEWCGSDVNNDSKLHVCLLGEVETKVRQIAALRRMSLSAETASLALRAFKPASIPDPLFVGPEWVTLNNPLVDKPASPPHVERQNTTSSGSHVTHSHASIEPYSNEVEIIISEMFSWRPDADRFRAFLTRFGGAKLLARPTQDRLSVQELDLLSRMKKRFKDRMSHADGITLHIDLYETEALARLAPGLHALHRIASVDRIIHIIKWRLRQIFATEDDATISRMIDAYWFIVKEKRAGTIERLQDQWERLCERRRGVLGELVSSLSEERLIYTYGKRFGMRVGMPLHLTIEEKSINRAVSFVIHRQSAARRFLDTYFSPRYTPWSPESKALRMLRRIDRFCRLDTVAKLHAHLVTIAEIFDRTIGEDTELRRELMVESMTGQRSN